MQLLLLLLVIVVLLRVLLNAKFALFVSILDCPITFHAGLPLTSRSMAAARLLTTLLQRTAAISGASSICRPIDWLLTAWRNLRRIYLCGLVLILIILRFLWIGILGELMILPCLAMGSRGVLLLLLHASCILLLSVVTDHGRFGSLLLRVLLVVIGLNT